VQCGQCTSWIFFNIDTTKDPSALERITPDENMVIWGYFFCLSRWDGKKKEAGALPKPGTAIPGAVRGDWC